jgi:hypothetical protein
MVLWCIHISYCGDETEKKKGTLIYNLYAGMLIEWPDYDDKQF